jgi:catechol 2,3-dioxygenase-like lactoylglutathione lyase family enzyme
VIGQLRSVVVDCKDPEKLAGFYLSVLGGTLHKEDETWTVLTEPSGRRIAFQFAPDYEPPLFPDPRGSQQVHFDIRVDDDAFDAAEREVLALGATRVIGAVEDGMFRVFKDPAGHPFCLVWGVLNDS